VNPELTRQALAKVGAPGTLINLVSRRVRQLTAGGGGSGRPLIQEVGNMGAADIALTEIITGAMSWEAIPDASEVVAPPPKKRRKSAA
jgi:hypothetical protein